MALSTDDNHESTRRSYRRRRTTIAGDFISTETEEVSEELSHNHNSNAVIALNQDEDVKLFVEESDDNDLDLDNERDLILNNEYKIERLDERLMAIFLIRRIIQCIVYMVRIFAWYCSTCREGGVIRCGSKPSQRMTTRAIVEHIESKLHRKHAPEPIKILLDEYKRRKQRMSRVPINYLCNVTYSAT